MNKHPLRLPSENEAIAMIKKYNAGEHLDSLLAHSKAVASFAKDVAKRLEKKGIKIDVQLVFMAGLLHDIGKNRMPGPCHSIASGEILRENGYEELAIVVEKHGLSKECLEEQGKIKEAKNFLPKTIEERVLCFADSHFEIDKKIKWQERIPLIRKRWKPEHLRFIDKSEERFVRNNEEIEKLLD